MSLKQAEPRSFPAPSIAFLRSLLLYQADRLGCDIDDDGRIEDSLDVAGQMVGPETFHPEWLLLHPCRIEGPIENLFGQRIRSTAVTNLREAYGLDLPFLRDTDRDGWPDVIDPDPRSAGLWIGIR